MARFLFSILLIFVAVQACHAISPTEVYWRTVLPSTKMPPFIHDLIYPVESGHQVQDNCPYMYVFMMYNDSAGHPEYIRTNFFLQKNIYQGAQLKEGVFIHKTVLGNAFVPRVKADQISLSSQNLTKILDNFSIVPGSKNAKEMKKFIDACKRPAMKDEQKFCTTSLESMIDNVISLLGTHDLHVISTTINGPREKSAFNITSPIKKYPDQDRLVICHPVPLPHASHYCHSSVKYNGYTMQLVGKDGLTVNAAMVCHRDTVNFNGSVLEVLKPGTEPICHILPEDHLFWIRNSNQDNDLKFVFPEIGV